MTQLVNLKCSGLIYNNWELNKFVYTNTRICMLHYLQLFKFLIIYGQILTTDADKTKLRYLIFTTIYYTSLLDCITFSYLSIWT